MPTTANRPRPTNHLRKPSILCVELAAAGKGCAFGRREYTARLCISTPLHMSKPRSGAAARRGVSSEGGIEGIDVQLRLNWAGIAAAVAGALLLGGLGGAAGRHQLNSMVASAPLPGATAVRAQPVPAGGVGTVVPPSALPDQILLWVPFTTQAPLGNWAEHQESCEAANLTQLWFYWQHSQATVIDPRTADAYIRMIDGWKPRPDLDDTMLGDLAVAHWGYTYQLLPDDPAVIAQQLSAGRPLLAEVRTHGLGNSHYPGYSSHFEQTGWSVPHFVTIIG